MVRACSPRGVHGVSCFSANAQQTGAWQAKTRGGHGALIAISFFFGQCPLRIFSLVRALVISAPGGSPLCSRIPCQKLASFRVECPFFCACLGKPNHLRRRVRLPFETTRRRPAVAPSGRVWCELTGMGTTGFPCQLYAMVFPLIVSPQSTLT